MKSKTNLMIVLGILIPSIAAGAILGQVSIVNAEPDQDSANCDKAGESPNPSGNNRGNFKQCSPNEQDHGPKEPVRDCYPTTENDEPRPDLHPNALKDNNGDGDGACKNRGSND